MDDILETLRIHRDATLEALGGVPKGLATDPDDWLPEGFDVWAFPDSGAAG